MQKGKNSLIQGLVLVSVIIVVSGIAYVKLYQPMINNIIESRETLKKLDMEMVQAEKHPRESKALSGEERAVWKLAQEELSRRFPPPENLPRILTFRNSVDTFYGEGDSLQQEVPPLFREVAQALFQAGGSELSIVANTESKSKKKEKKKKDEKKETELAIPASRPGDKPVNPAESVIVISLAGNFRQIGDFLGQLAALPRFVKVSKLDAKLEAGVLKASITVKTYSCPTGAFSNG